MKTILALLILCGPAFGQRLLWDVPLSGIQDVRAIYSDGGGGCVFVASTELPPSGSFDPPQIHWSLFWIDRLHRIYRAALPDIDASTSAPGVARSSPSATYVIVHQSGAQTVSMRRYARKNGALSYEETQLDGAHYPTAALSIDLAAYFILRKDESGILHVQRHRQ